MSESIEEIRKRLRENENEIENLKKLFSDSQCRQTQRESAIDERIMKSIDESITSLNKGLSDLKVHFLSVSTTHTEEIASLKASITIMKKDIVFLEAKIDNLTNVVREVFWYFKLLLFIVVAFWISMWKPAQFYSF